MENVSYSEWVPTGALVKSLFVGFSAYIVIFTSAIFLFIVVGEYLFKVVIPFLAKEVYRLQTENLDGD